MASPTTGAFEASDPASEQPSSTSSRRGRLLVVSGPSGVGKTTVVRRLREVQPFHFSVSATTRPPRTGEQHGIHYWFVSRRRFDEWLTAGRFLEWAEYGGHRYATTDSVLQTMDAGHDVLLDIENHGAMQVKERLPESTTIFLAPPSLAELERRLTNRGDMSLTDIERRLAVADQQIEHASANYDHVLVNEDVETVVQQIRRILIVDPHE